MSFLKVEGMDTHALEHRNLADSRCSKGERLNKHKKRISQMCVDDSVNQDKWGDSGKLKTNRQGMKLEFENFVQLQANTDKLIFSSVQSLSCVQFLANPWTAACQASQSIQTAGVYSNSCPLGW